MDVAIDLALPPDSIETAFPTDDEGFFDFMHLREGRTGIGGTIFLSTKVPQHGPRVKWQPTSPGPNPPTCSFTLDDPPRLVTNSLPERVVNAARADVMAWIAINRDALRAFWDYGAYWEKDQVDAFADALRPLPR